MAYNRAGVRRRPCVVVARPAPLCCNACDNVGFLSGNLLRAGQRATLCPPDLLDVAGASWRGRQMACGTASREGQRPFCSDSFQKTANVFLSFTRGNVAFFSNLLLAKACPHGNFTFLAPFNFRSYIHEGLVILCRLRFPATGFRT